MIRITSKKNNFRRCGIAHPDTPVVYEDDKFTAEELKRLQAEPMLIVETDYEAAAAAPKGPECKASVAVLKDRLKACKIEFPNDAKKDDLIALLLG